MTEQTQPTDAEHIPHTCGGFSGAFFAQHKRMPSAQEIWDAAIRSYRDLNRTPAGAGEPVAWMSRLPSGSEVFARTKDFYPDAVPVYLTPQPTQAQAGAVPLTDEWIRSKCKEPWIFETAKQWVRMTEAAHGIKGADHG